MIKNKKRLARAIALGLALSSVVAGSAWAETKVIKGNINYNIDNGVVNLPNDDIKIDWTDGIYQGSRETGAIWIGANITAKSLTIDNYVRLVRDNGTALSDSAAALLGKGISAYGRSVDVNANDVTINSYDDGIFTTRGDSKVGEDVTLNIHNLNITTVQGSGIINNGYSNVNVNGDEGSSVSIVAGDKGSGWRSRAIAVSNQTQGKEVNITANNVYLEAKGAGSTDAVIYSGEYSWGSEAKDNVTNIIAKDNLELKSRNYVNDNSTSDGYVIYISDGTMNLNKDITSATVTVNGNTYVYGENSKLNFDVGGTQSVINGNLTADSSSNIDINIMGSDMTQTGNIIAQNVGVVNTNVDGENYTQIGNLQTESDGIINTTYIGKNAKINGNIVSLKTTEREFSWDDWQYHDVDYVGGKITATFSGADSTMTGDIISDRADDKQGEVEVNFTGANASLTGDMQNNGGIITADFSGANAQWTGISSIEKDGTTDVSLSNNSTWNMTDTSSVTTLANNAMVDMTADGGKGSKLNVVTLSGSGSFTMNLTYLGNDITAYNGDSNTTSDFISVTGDSSGSHKIYFDNTDSNLGAMSIDDKLYFAEVQGSATFGDGKTITEVNAKKLYDRDFAIDSEDNDNSGKNWFITATERPEDPITPVDPVKPNENITSEEGKMRASYALGIEMDRLNKRLGESRYLNEDEDHGLWVRYRYNRNAWDNSYRTIGNMFQVGYDKLREEKDGRHIRGGAIDYTDANTTLKDVNGHGDHKRYSMSLYDTWTGDKGHYYDLVLRGGRIHSEFDVNMRGGRDIKSDYHRNFGSISGEYGRKLDGKKGWYVEPQAQLQVGVVGSGKYTTNYGVAVEQDTATSVQGRLGFRLGREMNNAEGNKRSNYYFKADVLHDFAGDQAYRVTSADGSDSYEKKFDGHDTWYDIGVGCDVKLSKNRYFFADVERSFGSDLDATWQVNGGFRWEF